MPYGCRGCQTEVQANLDRHTRLDHDVTAHGAVVVFWPDWSTFLDIGVLACCVAPDPVQVLATQHLQVIPGRQVVQVLGLGIDLPPLGCSEDVVVGLGVVWQIIAVYRHHATGLLVELPGELACQLFHLGQTEPPVVVVHRVGVHPDARPCGTTVALRWVSANAVCQSIDHGLGQLTRLVHPCACQFEGQQLADVFGLIERQEDDFAVDASSVTAGGQADVVRDRRRPEQRAERGLGEQIQPCLDGGGLQHRVAVSHDGEAAVADAVNGGRFLLDSAHHHLGAASVRLAAAHRAEHPADEGVVLQELPDGRALPEVQIQGCGGQLLLRCLFGLHAASAINIRPIGLSMSSFHDLYCKMFQIARWLTPYIAAISYCVLPSMLRMAITSA